MSDNGILERAGGIVIKEGFLVKQGHVIHNWKTRWFKLSDTSLRYYKSKNNAVPHGRIPLRDAKLSLYHSENKDDKDREFVMEVETREGVIYPIQAPSNEELKAWMECIHDAIEHLKLKFDHSDEVDLKNMVGATNSTKPTSSIADSIFFPPEILNASGAPAAVLPTDLPLGEIVKRGVLIKQGHVVPSWKARCFVLQRLPATLSYFDPSKKNPKVLNSLSLQGATVFAVGKIAAQEGLSMRYPPDHLFCVKVSDGTLYIITASSDVEREEWIEAIQPMCRKMKNAAVPSSGVQDSKT